MQQESSVSVLPKNRQIFYSAAIFLLLGAVVSACFQKQNESAVVRAIVAEAVGVAVGVAAEVNVRQLSRTAAIWEAASFAAVGLAVLSCGFALWYRENHQWIWVPIIVLLVLYAGLELMMV